MNSRPLVSVLMTAYNREKYIAEAIESVMASTYKNWELIIVDDRSKDNTVKIAKSYEAKDNRIKVYINSENLGDYPNRNKAATYANGKYIKYLDSDDLIYPEGLEYCVTEMEKYPGAFFGLSMIDGDESEPSSMMISEEVIRKHLFHSTHLSTGPSGTIINREFFEKIGRYDTRFKMASDAYFNMKAATLTPVVLLKIRFFFYRIHENQEQNNPKGYFVYGYLANKAMLKDLKLSLTKKEMNFLNRKWNMEHAVSLVKNILFKKKIRETLFVMKATNFGLLETLKGLLQKVTLKSSL